MSAFAMRTAIRNNELLRNKRERFKNRLGGYDKAHSTEYNLPKASQKDLMRLRRQVRDEHTFRMAKVVILTTFLTSLIIGGLILVLQ